jgi:DNA-binding CsgD family transcriptional regulator
MTALELWTPLGHDFVVLDGTRCSVGQSIQADVVIADDPAVSRIHLILEQIGRSWFVRDLGSHNGTLVNGERLMGERPLRDGDELLVGRTRLVYRDRASTEEPTTQSLSAPPVLTPRERDVLLELCRPLLCGNVFTPPAAVRQIAEALVVTQAAVKQHLGRLYDKFGIYDDTGEARRVRLANEAIRRAAVTMTDIRASAPHP